LDTDSKIVLLGSSSDYNKILVDIFMDKGIPSNQVRIDSTVKWEHFIASPLSRNQAVTTRNLQVNFTNIGYQSYLVEPEVLNFLNDTDFEAYRLGIVRANVQDFEPVLRDANLMNLSLNAVKFSDAPGGKNVSPNGLSGDEFCQLAYYSGYGNRLKVAAILDYLPLQDTRAITAALSAQAIWYICEGMALRINEDPEFMPELFSKYHIHLDTVNQNISFYKSNLTNRWWMEVEFEPKKRSIVFSCSEKDYDLACQQEIPDRWWRLFKRV
jgi:formiminoglutamase